MPPAPPVRPAPDAYHFHTYDYAGSQPFATSAAQPWGRYSWQYYSLVQDLNGLAAIGAGIVPNLVVGPVPGGAPTTQGRNTLMLSCGNAGNVAGRPTVVITGGVHAREWIATEVTYLIAEYLIVNYIRNPPPPRVQSLRSLVDSRNIHIIPMLNPDGNNRTVFGWGLNDRYWRKNQRALPARGSDWITALVPGGLPNPPTVPFANVQAGTIPLWTYVDVPDYDPTGGVPAGAAPGAPAGALPHYENHRLYNGYTGVDVNRNMATTGWAYDPPPVGDWDPSGGTFFGTAPGGEHEAANVQTAMVAAGAAGNIDVSIDYHSYAREILYPTEAAYGAGGVNGLAADYQRTGQLLRSTIVDPAGQGYGLGTPLSQIGYDATGSVADYAAEQHQARAFTIELDPAQADPDGFVLQENQIQTVFETNIRGALAAIAAPAAPPAVRRIRNRYLGWPVQGAGNQVP